MSGWFGWCAFVVFYLVLQKGYVFLVTFNVSDHSRNLLHDGLCSITLSMVAFVVKIMEEAMDSQQRSRLFCELLGPIHMMLTYPTQTMKFLDSDACLPFLDSKSNLPDGSNQLLYPMILVRANHFKCYTQ